MGDKSYPFGDTVPTWGVVSPISLSDGRRIAQFCKAEPSIMCDPKKMVVTCVLATASADRQGDIVDPYGVDTSEHELSPIVLYNHGISGYDLPIAKSQQKDGSYGVEIVGDRLVGHTRFSSKNQASSQLFSLVHDDIIRGWSIGFNPIEGGHEAIGKISKSLGRAPLKFNRCTLVEYSLTPQPVNPEAMTIMVEKGMIGGERMHALIRKSLSKFALPAKVSLLIPPTLRPLPVADDAQPQVRKAMANGSLYDEDDENMDEGADDGSQPMDEGAPDDYGDEPAPVDDAVVTDDAMGAPQTKPTVGALYDLSQGILDVLEQCKQKLLMGEHLGGRAAFDEMAKQLAELAKSAKAKGDEISKELGDHTEPDGDEDSEASDGDADNMPVDDEGGVVTKSGYKPVRWTTADYRKARQNTPKQVSDPEYRRELARYKQNKTLLDKLFPA